MIEVTASVTTTATVVQSGLSGGSVGLLVTNTGQSQVFVGDAAVTATSGEPVPAGASLRLSLASTDRLYAVVASGTGTLTILRNENGPPPALVAAAALGGGSNLSTALLPSASYAVTQTSADQTAPSNRAVDVILDVTVIGTATVTVSINGKDPASGKYYLLLAGPAVIANGTTVMRVGPGLAAAANTVAAAYVPRTFQIVAALGGTGAATFSVGYNLNI